MPDWYLRHLIKSPRGTLGCSPNQLPQKHTLPASPDANANESSKGITLDPLFSTYPEDLGTQSDNRRIYRSKAIFRVSDLCPGGCRLCSLSQIPGSLVLHTFAVLDRLNCPEPYTEGWNLVDHYHLLPIDHLPAPIRPAY